MKPQVAHRCRVLPSQTAFHYNYVHDLTAFHFSRPQWTHTHNGTGVTSFWSFCHPDCSSKTTAAQTCQAVFSCSIEYFGVCPHFTNQQAEVCCHFQADRSGCTGCFQTYFGTETLRFMAFVKWAHLRCQVEIVRWLRCKSSDVKRTVIPSCPEGIQIVDVDSTRNMRNQICQIQGFCN